MDAGLTPESRRAARESGNSHDRTSTKALLTHEGEIRIGVPRGRCRHLRTDDRSRARPASTRSTKTSSVLHELDMNGGRSGLLAG